jgi:hypothetical protein
MIDQQCLRCDFYDPDCECTCPSYDKWYACPIEAALPENQDRGSSSGKSGRTEKHGGMV